MMPCDPSPSPLPLVPPPPPPLTEGRFMDAFKVFSDASGVRLNEQDFFVDGRQVNPWELHKTVFARNGFDSVTANGEWPMVGVELGFQPWGASPQVTYCKPAVAHQLHQLYQDTLRDFDKAYSRGTIAQMRNSQAPGQAPSQPPQSPAQPPLLAHKPTEADYQVLLANTMSDSSIMTFEAMSILPRFWDTCRAELEVQGVPQRLIGFIELNREQLKLLARGPQLRTPTESPSIVGQNQIPQVSGLHTSVHSPPQSLQYYRQRELQRRADRVLGHGGVLDMSSPQYWQQVAQGNLTQQQALDRISMLQASAGHPYQGQNVPQQLPPGFNAGMPANAIQQQMSMATLSQPDRDSTNNQINPPQRIIQAQGPSYGHQFNMLVPQGQQQQNGSGLASRMGQNLNPPGIGLPQEPASPQPNFIQSSPSIPHANAQIPSAPSASQPPPQQVFGTSDSLTNMPLPQLRALYTQLLRIVMVGEKNLQTASGSGESDTQRQLRAKIDNNKRYLLALQELIIAKARASGDPAQQAIYGPSWLMNTSSTPSMGQLQFTGFNSGGGVQIQTDAMPVPMNLAAMDGVHSGLILNQNTGATQIQRPAQEDIISAKRWVDEKKRVAFSCVPEFSRVATYPVTESEIQEYHRNLERLGQVLAIIDKYIHVALAALKKEEVFEVVIEMMTSVKFQMEEFKKPNPRYVLEIHTIRGMIQEADNIDKGLRAVISRAQAHGMPHGVSSASQSPPQLPSVGLLAPSTQPGNPDSTPPRDESAPSPEGATTYREGLFDEEVRIAMGKLNI